jgi:hypothetical protein
MAQIAFDIFIPDFDPPILKDVEAAPVSDSVSILWTTSENNGTVYWLISGNATESQETLSESANSRTVTYAGVQPNIDVFGLDEEQSYYAHIMHEDVQGNQSEVVSVLFETDPAPVGDTIIVNDDASFLAAIAAGTYATILVAPGTYSDACNDAVAGDDRTSLPLTIEAQNELSKPIFEDCTQSLVLTRHVKWRTSIFRNAGGLTSGSIIFYDAGAGPTSSDFNNVEIDGVEVVNSPPANLTDLTKNPTYAVNQCRFLRASNQNTHTYKIKNCKLYWVYQFADLRFNGPVEITNNLMSGWYFDGIRYLGTPDEGRVAGNKIVAFNDFSNAFGLYNEITSASPHPDFTQGFNTGSTLNNTNPKVEDLIFYQNRWHPGALRGINLQAGLTQTQMLHVGYVENLWCTRGNVHGVSLESGSDAILIERMTMAATGFDKNCWVRLFQAAGQVLVKDSIFRGGFNYAPPNLPNKNNLATFELTSINNLTGTAWSYDQVFVGPADPATLEQFMTAFTPRAGYEGYGALNGSGAFKNLPHVPMRAAAPVLSGGTGNATLTTINSPTLMSPNQVALGGTTYTRTDLRHRDEGSNTWTEVTGVTVGVPISMPAGNRVAQTRKVNSAGEGLWSKNGTVTVS